MRKLTNTIDRTAEYVNFINNLTQFHAAKGTTLQVEPILGKKRLNLLKLFKIVMNIGGFDKVTQGRAWKQVGNQFGFPATCTNSAYILKGLYIRNLLGWEEEHVNGKVWKPPEELKGPDAHKLSTLAGNRYRKHVPGSTPKAKQKKLKGEQRITVVDSSQDPTYPLTPVSQDSLSYTSDTNDPIPATNDALLEESVKQKILFALRFGSDKDIDWALHFLLDLTFTTPHHLPISTTPMLMELLLDHGRPYIKHQQKQHSGDSKNSSCDALSSLMDMDDDNESTVKYDRLKKVLHVIRNYSTMEPDATAMATHVLLKELLIATLDLSTLQGNLELSRYCVDIVEKMTAHIPLAGPDDLWIPCLTKLIYAQDPYVVVASIRSLTVIGMCDLNQLFLANNNQVIACIAQNLLATDEEMVGVSLEYLYQQVYISAECKSQMLSAYGGAYVALLVEKVQSTSKYYVSKLIKEEIATAATSPNSNFMLQPLSPSGSSSSSSSSSGISSTASSIIGAPTSSLSVPGGQYGSVPDLTNYSTLDEPFRCLGWLKDKFEVTTASSSLSLDDMYLLYYSRFGTEKALKLNHFYSVLTIGFPEEPPTHIMENGQIIPNTSKTGTKIEGLCVKGLQIKMNILHDEAKSQYVCQWNKCTNNIHNDQHSLDDHIINDHALTTDDDEGGQHHCKWLGCTTVLESKDDWIMHIHGHTMETSPSASAPAIESASESSSLSTPTATPSLSLDQHDSTGLQNMENGNNTNSEPTTPVVDSPAGELKGIPLVAIHLLRSLSEDPTASTYMAPYEIKLINAADSKPLLSPFVYSILSNIRIHSTVTSPTSL
ncbi:unnamed protein product [Absidia cylindrospora]